MTIPKDAMFFWLYKMLKGKIETSIAIMYIILRPVPEGNTLTIVPDMWVAKNRMIGLAFFHATNLIPDFTLIGLKFGLAPIHWKWYECVGFIIGGPIERISKSRNMCMCVHACLDQVLMSHTKFHAGWPVGPT